MKCVGIPKCVSVLHLPAPTTVHPGITGGGLFRSSSGCTVRKYKLCLKTSPEGREKMPQNAQISRSRMHRMITFEIQICLNVSVCMQTGTLLPVRQDD